MCSEGVAKWGRRERLLETRGNASRGMHKLLLGKSQITVFSEFSLETLGWLKRTRGPKTINYQMAFDFMYQHVSREQQAEQDCFATPSNVLACIVVHAIE
jgi:hypothetical protein